MSVITINFSRYCVLIIVSSVRLFCAWISPYSTSTIGAELLFLVLLASVLSRLPNNARRHHQTVRRKIKSHLLYFHFDSVSRVCVQGCAQGDKEKKKLSSVSVSLFDFSRDQWWNPWKWLQMRFHSNRAYACYLSTNLTNSFFSSSINAITYKLLQAGRIIWHVFC